MKNVLGSKACDAICLGVSFNKLGVWDVTVDSDGVVSLLPEWIGGLGDDVSFVLTSTNSWSNWGGPVSPFP